MRKKNKQLAGGYGIGLPAAKDVQIVQAPVNPFMLPKNVGLNIFSQLYPNNYYKEWTTEKWRQASDKVIRSGDTKDWAVLISWCFQSSTFIQGLFNQIDVIVQNAKIHVQNSNNEKDEFWSEAITDKKYFKDICREIAFSRFWGFSGLNFDIKADKTYKYPIAQIEPINRMLKPNSQNNMEGYLFDNEVNLLFFQNSVSDDSFLGWMQPISRAYINMRMMADNWIAAGRRLSYPIPMVKYPSNGTGLNDVSAPYNPFRDDAISILESFDSQKGVAVPYTVNSQGEKESFEFEFVGGSKGGNGAQSIYKDFNDTEKKDILQMIFGESLSTDAGKIGSQALGNVQNEKRGNFEESFIDWILSELNDEFKKKISFFYKNLPANFKFEINRTKKFTLQETEILSKIVNENGKNLSSTFFEQMGLSPEYLEDKPVENSVLPANNNKPAQAQKKSKLDFIFKYLKKKKLI